MMSNFFGHSNVRFLHSKAQKRGFASRFHQLDGGLPLEFINIVHTAPKRGSASRIHQHTAPKWGVASRIHQHHPKNGGPPLGTISMDLAVHMLVWGGIQVY